MFTNKSFIVPLFDATQINWGHKHSMNVYISTTFLINLKIMLIKSYSWLIISYKIIIIATSSNKKVL